MRPLFYDFPEDVKCWETEDEYMFGPEILVAPILYEKQRERTLYPVSYTHLDVYKRQEYKFHRRYSGSE